MFKKLLPFFIPLAFLPTLIETSRAGLIVTDPTLIATNQAHHAKDLAEQLIRKANQETQILRLAEQIAQTEDYLERYGHPGIPVANPELRKLIDLLRAASPSKSTEELIRGVDGSEIFRTGSGEANTAPTPEITLDDGKTVARNPALYKTDAEAKRGFDHYHEVRTEVLERRKELRSSVASTTAQLQAAQTESEVRKLTAVLTGLQTELSAIDQEIGFAASELVAQQSRAEADRRLRAKARLEDDRTRHREASRKDAQFYRLMTSPTYFRSRK
ncbi:MAG: hypothetical protein KDN22_07120 [Verrucomicrobiae bacterium]|nr:hypothetical protein [Verrucomicrobiae bacterium]